MRQETLMVVKVEAPVSAKQTGVLHYPVLLTTDKKQQDLRKESR